MACVSNLLLLRNTFLWTLGNACSQFKQCFLDNSIVETFSWVMSLVLNVPSSEKQIMGDQVDSAAVENNRGKS